MKQVISRISNLPIAIPAHVRFAEVGIDCSLPYATYSYKGAACNIVTMLTNADSLSPFEISSLSLSLSLCSSRGAPHGAYTGRILPTWRCRILEGWHEPLQAYIKAHTSNSASLVTISKQCRPTFEPPSARPMASMSTREKPSQCSI